ncbi:double-strand break repair protein AddB [Bradyrhizobium sp. U87765 SZCCT0131]|uniref:double-strand break repair protein AddB n=1 Tax=unclassified Bradyrhizobium TaxID=2631580 RepID=UPI001BA65538|nr:MULTISPECIES: double-strand break repair protein AddB [unclassified Bradyrhizobium]MBR1216705.1 double-strand break repair protein AddB [Bradyrhizobium sp. U87765 SZCCT0131]MBR1259539.1 double-strand break repair protein AddB [Bradyrhizobium sp. U87765 SZCCT0134]MBR1305680.1 double-strand break repair protein AddB [Bradyrhizobium sp. U87765 SZCCT0110]MBR1322047.1 double-strand break repair protein AddB [Bradyrhizobium sp. U87765 SZCCT0109]MBR1350675.1 double-strand break repair protein AddB
MHVFTVPASVPFLPTVLTALVDGRLVHGFEARTAPERLADVTLYLPTRRAGRAAREVFLDVLGTDAVVLPRILPLGDIDEDELVFAQAAQDPAAALDLEPALGGLERRLVLAQLIAAWAKQTRPANPADAPLVVGGPASILALADDLARLMDDITTRGVPWQALDGLVPDAYDVYWQQTLKFLRIAADAWPRYLAERGKIEPAQRRDRLIEAEARRLAAHTRGPVIAAGSTGSMPATAKFLKVVASLPNGAVVLPGLDTDLDADAWSLIGGRKRDSRDGDALPAPGHPQFALHGLLERFGIDRDDVVELAPHAPHGREMLTSEALRPSNATAQWHQRLSRPEVAARIADGMADLAVVEAPTADMEALAIAVAMREAHQRPDATVALVTPDRALARRVVAALDRWSLDVDDSGGDSLMDTSAGLFARLVAAAASDGLAPATLLALLKHPLLRLGHEAGTFAAAIGNLELALLRGTRPQPGTAGLQRDFAAVRSELTKLARGEPSLLHRSEARTRLAPAALDAVADLIARLHAAFAPLERLGGVKSHDLTDIASAHHHAIVALSVDARGLPAAFEGPDGLALARAFDELPADGAPSGVALTLADYPDVFQTTFGDRIVRRPQAANARLRIFGPLEARLTTTDRVILGGLVEGTWPPDPRIDPWLNRPMRHQLGLDLPERRIGLSAHDFAQLLGAREVILTHAAKVGGSPAVASRFLHRLEAVAGEARWRAARAKGEHYLTWAMALDRPATVTPIGQPQPRPPRASRPMKMSVTEIEDWLRDPYTIYARRILTLQKLDPVDMPLSAADRGSAIHGAIGEFTQTFSERLPDDPVRALRAIGESHFAPLMERPEARALWWPRFLRIASWFAGWERERRALIDEVKAEIRGEIVIPIGRDRAFTLSARADRIDRRKRGDYAVLDYKTGAPPTGKQVRMGLSPQLTLESVILREGGFDGIAAGASVGELMYIRLSGNSPPGRAEPLELTRDRRKEEPISPDEAAIEARAKLEALIRAFENEQQAYTSLNLTMWANRYGDYDDLARIKEWSAAGDGGDEL